MKGRVPKFPPSGLNAAGKSVILEFLEMAAGVAGLIALGYYLAGVTLNILADKVPVVFERKMARLVDLGRFETPFYAVEAELEAQRLTDELAKMNGDKGRSYTVRVHDSERMETLALPGNHIVITSGLLNAIQSENELVFFLAGAMGRFQSREHLRALGRGAVVLFLTSSGSGGGPANFLKKWLPLKDPRFSFRQVAAADRFALDVLEQRYGHVGGALDFFRRLEAAPGPEEAMAGLFPAGHSLQDRVGELQARVTALGYSPGEPTPLDPAKFRRGGLQAIFDRSYPASRQILPNFTEVWLVSANRFVYNVFSDPMRGLKF